MKPAKPQALSVSLEPSPQAAEGVSLLQQAQGLSITDKASHELTRTFLKGAKLLKRTIEDHYAKIKAPLNAARQTVLDMEKQHLAPVLSAIALAEKIDTVYVREQEARERADADQRRRDAEAVEQAKRDKEAAEAEAAALKLEASSPNLSAREQMVLADIMPIMLRVNHVTIKEWVTACKRAGYKDPVDAGSKLMMSGKMLEAIHFANQAAEIRQQAEAQQSAPILVDVPEVESQIGSVAGTGLTTNYFCSGFNTPMLLRKLADDYGKNPTVTQAVDDYLAKSTASQDSPLLRMLSAQAKTLKALFPQVWPMATSDKTRGVRG